MTRKTTKEEFIEKARLVHGDKFRYDSVVYVNNSTKVKIFCTKCQEYFEQTPKNHLHGYDCNRCGKIKRAESRKNDISELLEKAKQVHNDMYDYSEVKYTRMDKKVKIKCKTCGEYFYQTLGNHIRLKNGCPKCAVKRNSEKLKLTQNKFIERAKAIHGDHYDYSEIEYNGIYVPIKIFCNECKKYFYQIPHNHLYNAGCPDCGIKRKCLSKEDFLKYVEDNKLTQHYSFDKIEYVDAATKVCIHCKACNQDFYATPSSIKMGYGCPYCNKSKGERKIEYWLIQNNISYVGQKRFIDCRDRNPLPFDFFLPEHNICIEFQGEQHYTADFFVYKRKDKILGNKDFETLKSHDLLKEEYCKNNGIKLLTIKYDEDIIEKLSKEIIGAKQ
jgi:hypothetical protein